MAAGERSNGIRPEPFLWLGRIGQRHFWHPITLFICHFDPCRPPSTLIHSQPEKAHPSHILSFHMNRTICDTGTGTGSDLSRAITTHGLASSSPVTTVEHEYWGGWPSKQMRRAEREYSAVWKSFCVQGSPCSSTTTTTTTDETERTHKIKVIKMLNLFSSSHTHTPGNNLNKCKSRDMNKIHSICCLCLVDTWVDCDDDPVDDRYDENDTNDGHPWYR